MPSTPSQSTPDMSGVQKSRRISRPASSKACRHSAAGSAVNLARVSSTVTDSAEPRSSFCSDGRTRRSPWSLTTSRVPSPLTSNQSSSPTSSVTSRLPRSNRSRTGRGASSSALALPSPSTPATGSRSQASPPLTARSPEYLASITGTPTTRPGRPSASTDTSVRSGESDVSLPGAGEFGPRTATGQRPERRRGPRAQRHEVGRLPKGKLRSRSARRKVEAAPGDEREVEAVEREQGRCG